MAFTWIPFYKEFGQKLLQFRNNRKPLIDWIYGNIDGNFIKHFKDAPDGRRVADTDPFTVMAIANRIYDILERKGMSQKDFAKLMGKTETEVSRWLSGKHNLTLATICKISAALDADVVKVASYNYEPAFAAEEIR